MTKTRKRSQRQKITLAQALIGLVILIVIYLVFEEPAAAPTQPEMPSPVVSAGTTSIQAYFTTPTLRYPDQRDSRGESPLLNAVIADVNSARSTVDVAVFDIDLESLGDALLDARERGVTVRVVIDSENLDTPEVAELAGRLEDRRIPVVFDEREAFMHNKFIVVDRQIVWTGSWNMTENDTFRNNNNMVRIPNQQLAGIYQREFEQMMAGVFGNSKESGLPRSAVRSGDTVIEVYFSPEDEALPLIIEKIDEARESIRFMAFSFTSAPISDAMAAAIERGVKVEGVMEKQNVRGTGSAFPRLGDGGIDVLPDGNCYILHHKVIIIDDRIVITGSYNFTNSAERDNDENLVIIQDRTITRLFDEEYQRIRQLAEEPLRCG